jgi:hypothetical protein
MEFSPEHPRRLTSSFAERETAPPRRRARWRRQDRKNTEAVAAGQFAAFRMSSGAKRSRAKRNGAKRHISSDVLSDGDAPRRGRFANRRQVC